MSILFIKRSQIECHNARLKNSDKKTECEGTFNWKLHSDEKQTPRHANQLVISALAMATTAGHRPVSPTRGEPARRPRGRPAVQQVSTNKQSRGAATEETAALTTRPPFLRRPHRSERRHSIVSPFFFSSFLHLLPRFVKKMVLSPFQIPRSGLFFLN